MLLLAQDEGDSTARMTDEQVRDESMTILLAGELTTANSFSWAWYLRQAPRYFCILDCRFQRAFTFFFLVLVHPRCRDGHAFSE
jgi:hypothetical protein